MIPTSMKMPSRYRIHTTSKGCRIYDYKVFDFVRGEDGKMLLFTGHEETQHKGSPVVVTAYQEASNKLYHLEKERRNENEPVK